MSIAIASFNSAAHIRSSVLSAMAQTVKSLEIIVVDDCSTDSSVSIVQALSRRDPRVILLQMEQNRGPAAARNRALDAALGTWFAVLDSDDLLAPDRIECLVREAERSQADLLADNLLVFHDDDRSHASYFVDPSRPSSQISVLEYLAETVMYKPGLNYGYLKPIFRRSKLLEAGLRYNEALRIAEDDDIVLRALLANLRYGYVAEAYYAYRRHAASTSHRLSMGNALAMQRAADRLIGDYTNSSHGRALKRALTRRRNAFSEAAAFARFIDALKRRDLATAIWTFFCTPRIIPLLRMPISSRIGQIFKSPVRQTDASASKSIQDIEAIIMGQHG